jgi:hypothetical protein
METSDPHTSDDRAPETLDERRTEPYEPPSFTELGSFRDLTAQDGKGFGGRDVGDSSGGL